MDDDDRAPLIAQTLEDRDNRAFGQRIDALNKDPAQLWPNTEEGKAALIESLNHQVAALDPLLPRLFGRLPRTGVEVRRVPPEGDFPAGMALMLWRRTDDTERAVEFWRRYGY